MGLENKKIIVMTRSHHIDPEVRLERHAASLGTAGYDVHLLGWDREGKRTSSDKRDSYTVCHIRLKAPLGPTILLYMPIWWILEFVWLLRKDWDVVHAADLDTFVPALLAAKLKRKQIVYDIFDFYAEQVRLPRPLRWIIATFDRLLMKLADVVVLTDESIVYQIGGTPNQQVVIVANSPNEAELNKADWSNFKPHADFTLFFGGKSYAGRNVEKMAKAVKNLNVKLLVMGTVDAVTAKKLENEAKNATNIKLHLTTMPYQVIMRETMRADLLFTIYDPAIPNNRILVPHKLFEAMCCSKPILVSAGTKMAEIVEKDQCGIIVDSSNNDEIRDAIIRLKESPELCKQLGENGRRAYHTKYSWKIMERRLIGLYHQLLEA